MKKFQAVIIMLETTIRIEEIASMVMMSWFGSNKVMACVLLRYIDDKTKAMNIEFPKFAANKRTHLNFI